jgi:LDH2 family malate/lactate/ureidoglycolate dehydrogenase
MQQTPRFAASALAGFATGALQAAGMEPAKADAVADILVEGDLLGHTTHGLQLLPLYLAEIEKKQMTLAGEPRILADHPAAVTWDGRRLPGPWLTLEAIALACVRARTLGCCTVVIRRSHHIGCLAAYLKRVTDQGLMILLTCSDPSGTGVAPHGGYRGAYTPNPRPSPGSGPSTIAVCRRTIPEPCSQIRPARCCRSAERITATRASRWGCSSRR